MAERVHLEKHHQDRREEGEKVTQEFPVEAISEAELQSETDRILDEIDEILEVSPELVVSTFIQRGGQ
ncbi:MAG: Pup-like protein [Patescibacteria group bacterium]|nr:Pup-like protein [Patescibacteria group bacterium]